MTKKGEILNQLAIISDLVEKINFETNLSSLVFNFEEKEFDRVYSIIYKKLTEEERKINKPDSSFTIRIGQVDIVFNKSNV